MINISSLSRITISYTVSQRDSAELHGEDSQSELKHG
jgi:hypothetical protein